MLKKLICTALCTALSMLLFASSPVTVGELASGVAAPSEKYLEGTWGYAGYRFVFMEKPGETPSDSSVKSRLDGMGTTYDNLELSFSPGKKGCLRLGDNKFDFSWTQDPSTMVFSSSVAFITLKGYLIDKGDRIVMVYSRPDLFLMMKYLCTADGRKNIKPLGSLLDSCKGLTVGMEFIKK